MQRWYQDRIGGMFTANAEALADRALIEPCIDPIEFNLRDLVCGYEQPNACLQLPSGDLKGWKKHSSNHDCGTELVVGTLATLLGAAAAPVIAFDKNHIFSPICASSATRVRRNYEIAMLNPAMLGAAGQFRYWINDADGEHNTAWCKESCAGYIFDFEDAQPWAYRTSVSSERFIEATLAAQVSDADQVDYKAAAKEMASRIFNVTDMQIATVVDTIREAGISVNSRMEEGLINRRASLQRPVYPQSIFDWCEPKFN